MIFAEYTRPMSHAIVFCARSLDGYIADRDGGLDFLQTVPNPTGDDMGFAALMAEVDAVVMGRVTFETVLRFGVEWPYGKTVYVLTRTLDAVPEALVGRVELLAGEPDEVLARLAARGHERLYLDGGQVVRAFLAADLVDELRITTLPILLGGGTPLFGALTDHLAFRHVSTEVFLGQVVQSRYLRQRTAT